MIKDIEGNALTIGDNVYYARKANYYAKGELVKCVITNIKGNKVMMGAYTATTPETQLLKIRR